LKEVPIVAGLNLNSLRVREEEALSKPAFKPAAMVTADPVPAARPQSVNGDQKLIVGHYAPDPVPSGFAHEFEAPAPKFNEGFVRDPVPARSA
jgi:hypothetical protein